MESLNLLRAYSKMISKILLEVSVTSSVGCEAWEDFSSSRVRPTGTFVVWGTNCIMGKTDWVKLKSKDNQE